MVAVYSTMTTSNSRSNSPTFSASSTRSRSTSASQFGQKLKGLFKFTHTNISTHKSSSQHSSSTEHLPRVPTPPSSQNGNNSQSQYFMSQSHHHANGTSTGQSSADGMDSLGGDSFNASELEDAIHTASVVTVEETTKPDTSPPLSPTSALKRQLRRVASAPNAHGLLTTTTSTTTTIIKNGTSTSTTGSNQSSVDSRKNSPLAPPPRPPTADGIPANGLTGDARQNGYLLPV